MVTDRLNRLRKYMVVEGISLIIIPTSDPHMSEYIAPYYKAREYYSGFTGSAGTILVGLKDAYLYTDSRYYIQAAKELAGSGIVLMKDGEESTPYLKDFILELVGKGECVGFDGSLMDYARGMVIKEVLAENGIEVNSNIDYGIAWNNRPLLQFEDQKIYDLRYAGESTRSKIDRLIESMKKNNADSYIITSLDDIAYLMNMRGNDIACNPVFYAYMIITGGRAHLYANIAGVDADRIASYVCECGVELHSYESFYEEGIQRVNNGTRQGVILDYAKCNYRVVNSIASDINKINLPSLAAGFKAVKNKIEIDNIRYANVMDGVALLKFNKWLEEAVNNEEKLTEILIQEKLREFRAENPSMLGDSFDTICAYGEHGAIVHYEASDESNANIGRGSFLLIDSGAQYLEGTTDITRTYPIGDVDEKLKHDYTLVLKAALKLMFSQFKYGTRGSQLDMLVKDYYWSQGLDFGHGTGHGIGCYLNVHEAPVTISWRIREDAKPGIVFEPGMLVSDEPGIYIEGEYGIRIETDLMCEDRFNNEYGRFLGFEPITLCPIDTGAIDRNDFNAEDIDRLNRYHEHVRIMLEPYVDGTLMEYLMAKTKPLT